MHEILINELNTPIKCPPDTLYIDRNQCVVGDYLASVVKYRKMCKKEDWVLYLDAQSQDDACALQNEPSLENAGEVCMVTEYSVIPKNTKCIFTVDCMDKRYQTQKAQEEIETRLRRFCTQFKDNTCLFLIVVPQPTYCPNHMTALAEREYDALLLNKEEQSWEEKIYLRLESVLRENCHVRRGEMILLRCTNVLGAECRALLRGFDMSGLVQEMREERTITIRDGDQLNEISITSISDILQAAFAILKSPAQYHGHTYQISTYRSTICDIKYAVYNSFSNRVTLQSEVLKPGDKIYHCLNANRLRFMLGKTLSGKVTMKEALYRTVAYLLDEPYDITRKLSAYTGRLPLIQGEEKVLLKVIDRICRENGIHYFVTAGTLLGAVRHRDMIPWDDDIDIGMLRPEYEKFRRICPQLLPEEMTYEAANGESGSHYHFDRIRLKETYYSTYYSNHFMIPDGIFIDVLVYDQTSNFRFLQKLHIRMVTIWTRVINVKWFNKNRKGVHYRLTRIALPVMRKINWDWFHKMFDRIAQYYSKKKNAKYVIDTMGLYIKKGALEKAWLENTQDVEFGDMQVPVPTGYAECLTHFYGERWMDLLPVDKRVSGHKIARIDLGDRVISHEKKGNRNLDIRGELYEEISREENRA